MNQVKVGNYVIGGGEKLTLLAGPCVLEGLQWKLLRLWTLDWLLNREAVTARILDTLQQLQKERQA